MTTVTIPTTVKLPAALVAKISAHSRNKSRYILEAVEEKLANEVGTPRERMAAHIRRYAGTWRGARKILERTRP